MYHALGLVAVGFMLNLRGRRKTLVAAAWCFFAGIILFSGSLYALTLSGQGWLGAITPFGGLAYIVAWSLFAAGAISR
jgi:uncharacterized membrane protein YgdD (TMEM256/DUF423 family)